MTWCWLIGHHYDIQTVGNNIMKICPRCGKSFDLMERRTIGGHVTEEFWREVREVPTKVRKGKVS